jgi:hypothetical protein
MLSDKVFALVLHRRAFASALYPRALYRFKPSGHIKILKLCLVCSLDTDYEYLLQFSKQSVSLIYNKMFVTHCIKQHSVTALHQTAFHIFFLHIFLILVWT